MHKIASSGQNFRGHCFAYLLSGAVKIIEIVSTLCFREVFVKMCLPAAVLSLRLCCVATKVAGWNRGCGFAERFQQIALFNCKEFDYSERSRFRTFRLFCWTKISYLLDEINIYYMDPVTFSV